MKVIVAGSRGITDEQLIRGEMKALWSDLGPFEVVSGDARGVDRISGRIAERAGVTVHHFPADWDRLGRSAGYRRNEEMARFADYLLVFWDGRSKGTRHMMDLASKHGLPISVVQIGS